MEPISEQQLQAHISRLEDELRAAKAFLAFRKSANPPAPQQPPPTDPPLGNSTFKAQKSLDDSGGYGSIANDIRSVLADCPFSYSVDNIIPLLRAKGKDYDRDKVNQALSRFARTGEIKVLKKGAGKRPTVFEKWTATEGALIS